MPKMTGGRFIAETFEGYGISHVFFYARHRAQGVV